MMKVWVSEEKDTMRVIYEEADDGTFDGIIKSLDNARLVLNRCKKNSDVVIIHSDNDDDSDDNDYIMMFPSGIPFDLGKSAITENRMKLRNIYPIIFESHFYREWESDRIIHEIQKSNYIILTETRKIEKLKNSIKQENSDGLFVSED